MFPLVTLSTAVNSAEAGAVCPLLGWRGSCRANVPSGCDSPEAPHHRHTGLGRGAGSCGRRACPPPPRRPFRGFSRSVRILGPPMGPRDGRRAGLPGGVALACAHTVQTGQEASPGPPSRVLSIGPCRLLLHLPSHQLSPSAEKSQAPAFHVTSPPSPVLLCPQSHSGGRRLPFPANALAVGCHPRGLCCVWRR